MEDFRVVVRNIITNVFSNLGQYKHTNDILLQSASTLLFENYYKVCCIRTKIGYFWERIFCLFGYNKLQKGADIINHQLKIIMELKNSDTTDNVSSRKENIRKLIRGGIPDYSLVYGMINSNNPKDIIIYFDGYPIRLLSGEYLLKFVMGEYWNDFINIIQLEFSSSPYVSLW